MLAAIAFFTKYKNILLPIGAALLVVLLLFGIYERGRWAERKQQAEAQAAAQAKLDLKAQHATDVAASQRVTDTAAVATELATTKGTIDAQKDSVPSDAALALNCRRLLRAGTPLAKIPACGRFAPGH